MIILPPYANGIILKNKLKVRNFKSIYEIIFRRLRNVLWDLMLQLFFLFLICKLAMLCCLGELADYI